LSPPAHIYMGGRPYILERPPIYLGAGGSNRFLMGARGPEINSKWATICTPVESEEGEELTAFLHRPLFIYLGQISPELFGDLKEKQYL